MMETGCRGPVDLKTPGSIFGFLFECTPDLVFLLDTSGKIIDANYAAIGEYGYTRGELLSMTFNDIRAPGEVETTDKHLAEAFEKGAVYETVHRRKNGSTFPVEISARGIILDNANLLMAIVRDITRRKAAEERIAYAASFPEYDPSPILEVDDSGSVRFTNPAARRLFPDLISTGPNHPMIKGLLPFKGIEGITERTWSVREVQIGNAFYHQTIQYLPEKQRIRIYSADITERKDAEQALRESEQKCWAIFNWTFEFIGLLATDGTLLEVNRAALRLIESPVSDVLGKPFWTTPWWTHSPEQQEKLRLEILRAAEGKFIRFESNHRAPDGSFYYTDFSIVPLTDDEGNVDRLIVEGRDITERKLAEKALKKSQFILAKSQEMAHMGNWAWNPRTNEINMSDEGFRIFGYRPQELQPTLDWLISRVHPDDRILVSGKFDSIRRDGWLGSIDYRIILPNGKIQYLNSLADKIVRDPAGDLKWVYGINQDITERKQVEEALLQSRRQLADIIDHLPDATLVIDSEKKAIVWNRAMEEMTEVKAPDVIGKSNYEYAIPIYGERRPILIDLIFEPETVVKKWHYTNIRRVGRDIMAETSFVGPHGKHLVTWAKATPLFDRDGKLIGAIESIRDITELRQAEVILRESEEKFRVLAETSPAVIFLYLGDQFVYVNPSAERMTGYSKEELYAMKFWDIIHPDFRTMVRERGFARQLDQLVPSLYEFKYLKKNGDEGWALLSAGHIDYKGGSAGVGTIVDITKRKKAEEALEEAKNRAELYVDLMSHDIGNLNHATMGYLELAMDTLDLKGDERDLLTKPVELLQNSTKLIDDVKKIQRVKTGELPLELMDIGEVLTKVLAKFSSVQGRDVKIHYSPVPECLVMGNKYLPEAFSHLVENAIKHSRGPLSININISKVLEASQPYYEVTFEDTGPGIADERKKYLFMDLAIEKIRTRRLGLGLQLVKAVVESAHGKIWVEDRIPGEYGKGSKFIILLPASERS